jgi:tryptophan 2,3-dioxygenase
MEIEKKTEDLLQQLFEKYRLSGQNTDDYLEGLLVSNYEPYWKYLHLDTLLSLQNPKTDFNDEFIFITYHQITELYFKLILHEMDNSKLAGPNVAIFEETLLRVNRYFNHLIKSFEIMTEGMRPDEFLKFRMALLPASGFQSYQFRLIELQCTGLNQLMGIEKRNSSENLTVQEMYNNIYWKQGSIDTATGEKTLTLRQFEKQYDQKLLAFATDNDQSHIYAVYRRFESEGKSTGNMKEQMRLLDQNLNVNWRLAHYKSAVRYLHKSHGDIAATGGTNWQNYLPPRFQKVISFPVLWTETEMNDWGKQWVQENLIS